MPLMMPRAQATAGPARQAKALDGMIALQIHTRWGRGKGTYLLRRTVELRLPSQRGPLRGRGELMEGGVVAKSLKSGTSRGVCQAHYPWRRQSGNSNVNRLCPDRLKRLVAGQYLHQWCRKCNGYKQSSSATPHKAPAHRARQRGDHFRDGT